LPDELKAKWFQKIPGKRQWQIDPLLGNHIEWRFHDFLGMPPGNAFHLIMLRNNLLTYHKGPILHTTFENITRSLVVGGVLILGSREKLPSNDAFNRDTVCPWIYHRGCQTA
jgi:chemotaxis methyl-accepting protein methylase